MTGESGLISHGRVNLKVFPSCGRKFEFTGAATESCGIISSCPWEVRNPFVNCEWALGIPLEWVHWTRASS